MKTVRFTYYDGRNGGYKCSEPNNQDGQYVRAELVSDLVKAAMNYHLSRPSLETTDRLLAAIEALGVKTEEWGQP